MTLPVGVDIGGTFTDVVAWEGRTTIMTKVPTTNQKLVKGTGRELRDVLMGPTKIFHSMASRRVP